MSAQVVPLGFMFFCILFNYTILRDTKDVLVVTAPGSGAEIIPFLKTWCARQLGPSSARTAKLCPDRAGGRGRHKVQCLLQSHAFGPWSPPRAGLSTRRPGHLPVVP